MPTRCVGKGRAARSGRSNALVLSCTVLVGLGEDTRRSLQFVKPRPSRSKGIWMSEIIDSGLSREKKTSLLGGFDEDEFDALWDSAIESSFSQNTPDPATTTGDQWSQIAEDDASWSVMTRPGADALRHLGSEPSRSKKSSDNPLDDMLELNFDLDDLQKIESDTDDDTTKSDTKSDTKKDAQDSKAPFELQTANAVSHANAISHKDGNASVKRDAQPEDGKNKSTRETTTHEKTSQNEEDIPTQDMDIIEPEDVQGSSPDDYAHLSSRARMGKVQPENAVVTSEHDIQPDTTYPEELCLPDMPQGSDLRKRFLLITVILLFLVLIVCCFLLYSQSHAVRLEYARSAMFQSSITNFDRMAVSTHGTHKALCSDDRGIVVDANDQPLGEFWPTPSGCRAIQISDNGQFVWYIDNDGSLYKIDLVNTLGITPIRIAVLNDIIDPGFYVDSASFRWFARVSPNSIVLRTRNFTSTSLQEEQLPPDAIPCHGFTGERFAYVSENAIHIHHHDSVVSASLESPKLSCPQSMVLGCTIDDDNRWSVLCENSLRQGEGDKAVKFVELTNQVGLRSGADAFSLLRDKNGSDLITPSEWIHLDPGGNVNQVKFSRKLQVPFTMLPASTRDAALIGVAHGKLTRIAHDGEVVDAWPTSPMTLKSAAFVDDGTLILSVHDHTDAASQNQPDASQLVLWSASEARPVSTLKSDAPVRAIHVSLDGRFGFFVTSVNTLHWISWKNLEILGSLQLQTPVTDASWSDDDKYCLLTFENGTAQLFERNDKTMVPLRKYPATTLVAFAQNGLLWHYAQNVIRFERLSDGALSVVDPKLSAALAPVQPKGITPNPITGDTYFWGQGGAFQYSPKHKRLTQMTGNPVSWLTPDRNGLWVATSAGAYSLQNASFKPFAPNIGKERMNWIGVTSILQSGRDDVLSQVEKQSTFLGGNPSTIPFIGANAGASPVQNLALDLRGESIMLMTVQNDSTIPVATFAGSDNLSWCWLTASGIVQGQGNVCISLKNIEGHPATIAATQTGVSEFMHVNIPTLPTPAQTAFPLDFVDTVQLSIHTTPQNADLLFAANKGELPKALVSPDTFFKAPFQASIKPDLQGYGIAVMAPGYVLRSVHFTPDVAKIDLHIPLLPEGAQNIQIAFTDTSDARNPIRVSDNPILHENATIELASFFHTQKNAVHACLGSQAEAHFKIAILEDGTLKALSDVENFDTCMRPVLDDFQKHLEQGSFTELAKLPSVIVDVSIPR